MDKEKCMMVLNRNAALNSTLVGRIVFEKEVPTYVPPRGHQEALAMGAEFVDGSKYEPPKTDLPDEPSDLSVRMKAISEVIPKVVARNKTGDFGAAGIPRKEALKELIGFEPDTREIHAAWREFQTEQSEKKAEERIAARSAKKKATKKKRAKKAESSESDE